MAQRTGFTFFTDVPDLSAFAWPADSAAEAAACEVKPPSSWIQLFKQGRFKHPVHGRAVITDETYRSMIANFAASIPNDKLPGDPDHRPQRTGNTAAIGWIDKLEVRGTELWANVLWTWEGSYLIRDGIYRYISPTFNLAYVSDDETKRGPTLLGFALTNWPFLEGMAAISLSRTMPDTLEFAREEVEGDDPEVPAEGSDSRRAMTDLLKTLARDFGLGEDATEDQVLTAARDAKAKADRAPGDGKISVDAAEYANTQRQAAAGEKAAKDFSDFVFNTAWDKAVEGGVAEAKRDDLYAYYQVNAEGALKLIEDLTPDVNTHARGEGPGKQGGDAPDGVDADMHELDQKVQAHMREHNVSYAKALAAVSAQGGGA